MTSVSGLNEALAERLGDLLSEQWRDCLKAAPRHLFVPDVAWRIADGSNDRALIDRDADLSGWLDAAFSDDIIITTAADVEPSSCSMPYMVFTMLSQLGVRPNDKVLEIGTGTGWTAALLVSYLGSEQGVYSVEIDPVAAEQARVNLAKLGIVKAHLMIGDGAEGFPEGAPFDRIIATCTVHKVPYSWIDQCSPGAVIVTPWQTPLGHGALVRLTVGDDGTALGPFVHSAAFMWLRAQRPTAPDEPDDFEEQAEQTTTELNLSDVLTPESMFAVGMLVPDCKDAYDRDTDGSAETLWILTAGSWASVSPNGTVRQMGKRRLWDEVKAAYAWWIEQGSPDMTRFGMTVTAETQAVWLDDPENRIATIS